MKRRTIFIAVAALAVPTLVAIPADAAPTPPPTGTFSCATTGDASFKPSLPPVTPTTRRIKLHGDGNLESCDASGVSGGKATINAGTVTLSGIIPQGATCSRLFSGASRVINRGVTVRLKNSSVDAHGHTHFVNIATLHVMPVSIVASGNGFGLAGTVTQNAKGTAPFGGEALSAQLNFDNFSDAQSCSNGTGSALLVDRMEYGRRFDVVDPTARIRDTDLRSDGLGHAEAARDPRGHNGALKVGVDVAGTLDSCDASNVSGGSAVINVGTIEVEGSFPKGVSYATLFSTPIEFSSSKRFDVRLQHTDVNGFGFSVTFEVARARAQIDSSDIVGNTFVVISKPIPGQGAFNGEEIGFALRVDNLDDVAACEAGTAPLTTLDFSSTGGSVLAIGPFS